MNPPVVLRLSCSVAWGILVLWPGIELVFPKFQGGFFFFFSNFIFKLYIIVLVLPNIKMNPPQVYMCSPSWTLLPPPSPYHPSQPSQCTSPKHPASCIEPGLATRFLHDIWHVSLPFSQIFPPSPSPTESIRLFYTSVSLLLSRTPGYCYHLSKFHIGRQILYHQCHVGSPVLLGNFLLFFLFLFPIQTAHHSSK